ncbi:MAG: hypothetical protein P1V35_08940, partial [Planctomycetota bacterium]|nr:hypothetical protein [Planctomycetota bacterium]
NLINYTKREQIQFIHIPATKKNELVGCPSATMITTRYMLDNLGDQISFVSDTDGEWPFPGGDHQDQFAYPDVTGRVVDVLLEEGALKDCGFVYQDEDEPDTVYERDLRNAWWPDEGKETPGEG